jgi:hypothetical protein
MKRSRRSVLLSGVLGLTGCLTLSAAACKTTDGTMPTPETGDSAPSDLPSAVRRTFALNSVNPNPFADNNGQIPTHAQYSGPLFQLSHSYPTVQPPPVNNPPWIAALKGKPIGKDNALAYVQALKDYIADDMKTLLYNYPAWDAQTAGWYNEPWLASIRESIHGTYVGSEFPANTFPKSGLKVDMTTYVLTYYDGLAAYTLGQVWGKTAMNPTITTSSGQFPEGAIVVKVATTSALAQDWPAMEGASLWPVYVTPPNGDPTAPPQVMNTSIMQFDIIVKDSKTAPKTGWVFSTLVYDKSVPGNDPWAKMIPLGAMWGNDPTVNSTANPGAPLSETVINPVAPVYSTETLGWGGRLSGPNDGAVVAPAYYNGQTYPSVAASSCMSCHSSAQWPMQSFLLPSPTNPPKTVGDALVIEVPGSTGWDKWFQDNLGNVPMDQGSIAFDFDMVFTFKSLPAWKKATQGKSVMGAFEKADAIRGKPAVNPLDLKYNGQ